MDNFSQEWLKLDNAAKLYPASSSRKSPAQFRLSVRMKERINYNAVSAAWESMLNRCPYFQVHLKRGFFWYYLQNFSQIPAIRLYHRIPEIIDPRDNDTDLIRLSIRDNIISLDFSHILTDGNGGLRFFMGLIYEYLRQSGHQINNPENVPHPSEKFLPSEIEDAHRKYFPGNLPHPENLSAAFHIPGRSSEEYHFIEGGMPLSDILQIARNNNVSLTAYLAAVYLESLRIMAAKYQSGKKPLPIRLQVPVDMRRIYPSNTMRNFSLYVSPEIDLKLGDYDFKEILEKVSLSVKLQIDRKELARQISRNVGGELNLFVRLVPRLLKDLYLAGLSSRLGERCYSGVLSNLGTIQVTAAAQPYIESFEILVMPNYKLKKVCAVYSYDNRLMVSFCSVAPGRELERLFFGHFKAAGIEITVRE
ncbi:MAG: hypothetical protein K9N06_11525 [Candidatus Cloacimonetes bacterium]|nr:hypothetical protein [Candidatus Cloacimonadota bacterium]